MTSVDCVLRKYPNKVPLWIKKAESCKTLPDLHKNKFLVPKELKLSELQTVIRKHIKLDSSVAMFLMINGTMQNMNITIQELQKFRNEQGFIDIIYVGENTFGHML